MFGAQIRMAKTRVASTSTKERPSSTSGGRSFDSAVVPSSSISVDLSVLFLWDTAASSSFSDQLNLFRAMNVLEIFDPLSQRVHEMTFIVTIHSRVDESAAKLTQVHRFLSPFLCGCTLSCTLYLQNLWRDCHQFIELSSF